MTYPAHVQGAPADERLLRWIARESQRSRFLRLAEDDRRVLAQRVVDDAADRLHEQGYYVTRMQNNEHFDLLVNGVRAEVKAATWSRRHRRYQAAMRGNRADILIFGCQNGALHPHQPTGAISYFVVPWTELRGITNIAVCHQDVAEYAGRWRRWLERWDVLDAMIERGVNAWQMRFRWST